MSDGAPRLTVAKIHELREHMRRHDVRGGADCMRELVDDDALNRFFQQEKDHVPSPDIRGTDGSQGSQGR